MSISNSGTTAGTAFDLQLGPLHYRFESHDDWGELQLRAIADRLTIATGRVAPLRIIAVGRERLANSALWREYSSPIGTIACRADSFQAAWTGVATPDLPAFCYQLPWALILTDIAARNGAVAHAGFAAKNGKGLLFLAPPGGGKSTTLASVPADWEVLSDDAALVWPEQGGWRASPLPSWTMMTTENASSPAQQPFDPGRQRPLAGVIVLCKGTVLRLEPLSPVAAAPHLFRALGEYPSTVIADLPLTGHYFRSACALARALPCWRLELPLGGDPWPMLAERLEERP